MYLMEYLTKAMMIDTRMEIELNMVCGSCSVGSKQNLHAETNGAARTETTYGGHWLACHCR